MKKNIISIVILLSTLVPFEVVHAAISKVNNNFRVVEDTLWLIVFSLMIVTGILMKKLSWGMGKTGYTFLIITGLSGWCWKFIGLIKRVFALNQPEWLLSLTRETFEGLTGVFLAITFILLAYSLKKAYGK